MQQCHANFSIMIFEARSMERSFGNFAPSISLSVLTGISQDEKRKNWGPSLSTMNLYRTTCWKKPENHIIFSQYPYSTPQRNDNDGYCPPLAVLLWFYQSSLCRLRWFSERGFSALRNAVRNHKWKYFLVCSGHCRHCRFSHQISYDSVSDLVYSGLWNTWLRLGPIK